MADRLPEAWPREFATLGGVWSRLDARAQEVPQKWIESLDRLRHVEQVARARGSWARGPHDLMGILWLAHDEIRLCRVLAWLLDPEGSHGLGPSFISKLLRDWRPDAAPGDAAIDEVRVVPEDIRDGTRADIVIYGRGWTVVIEAKVFAPEQTDQGLRLETNWSRENPTFVFLTRGGRRVPRTRSTAEWVPYSWGRIASHLRGALESARTGRGTPAAVEFSRTLEAYYT